MTKRSRKTVAWIAAAVSMLFLMGWLILFIKPTLAIPRFLKDSPVLTSQTTYYEGIHTIVRGGQARHIPEATVTEKIVIQPHGKFDDILAIAEQELTPARGWDLGALPKEKIARFYQRSTNTSVSLHVEKGSPQVTISQTRFATPSDRMRNWWSKLRNR